MSPYTYSLKCPHCGGNLEVNGELSIFYCQFCGTKIKTEKVSNNELRLREMEHEERMKDKELKSDKWDHIETICAIALIAFIFLGLFLFTASR